MITRGEDTERRNNRKAMKNPFYKVHLAAMENGGELPEEKRQEMMRKAVSALREHLLKNE